VNKKNYRFAVGTDCQSSTACVHAHQTKPERLLSPFRLSQKREKKRTAEE